MPRIVANRAEHPIMRTSRITPGDLIASVELRCITYTVVRNVNYYLIRRARVISLSLESGKYYNYLEYRTRV